MDILYNIKRQYKREVLITQINEKPAKAGFSESKTKT